MRSTAGARTLTGETGTTRRRMASGEGGRTTGSVSRPTLGSVPTREKKPAGERSAIGTGGWAGFKKKREERSNRYPTVDVPEDKQVVIKFVEPEPFAFIYRHWPKGGRPDVCINDPENDVECPLCAAGDKPKPVVYYNVITADDNTLRVWEMSSEPTRKIQKQYDQLKDRDKTLDDDGFYFIVTKAKKDNGFFEYDVQRVRATDLSDEAGIDPLGPDEITDATTKGLYTDEIIFVRSRADLQEVADSLAD